MRVTSACDDAVAAERFAAWLLRVGDGREPTAKDIDLIPVPPAMAVNSIAELVNCKQCVSRPVQQPPVRRPCYSGAEERRL